jgi:hypothetical protein
MKRAEKDYRIVLLVALCLIAAIMIVDGKARNFDFVGYNDELCVNQNHYFHILKERSKHSQIKQGRA